MNVVNSFSEILSKAVHFMEATRFADIEGQKLNIPGSLRDERKINKNTEKRKLNKYL